MKRYISTRGDKIAPGRAKKQKIEKTEEIETGETILAQFHTPEGESTGPQLNIPRNITIEQLHTLLNEHILKNDEELPYSFFVNEEEIIETLQAVISKKELKEEEILKIIYQPQAIFRVEMVTHCVASLEGHSEAILSVSFSPDGTKLATGSGDTTVRLWDILTSTPYAECKGHKNWVLFVAWSPDGKKIASGSMDKTIIVWDDAGKQLTTLSGHKDYITSVSWEPLHRNEQAIRLVSASKDASARVWNIQRRNLEYALGNHSKSVTCVKWGGEGFIYTASQDTTIKVWSDKDGKHIMTLKAHSHWVNTIALNTDYVLRTGAHDHTGVTYDDPKKAQEKALERYNQVKGKEEILVSGSDDCTCYLWHPNTSKEPVTRLTGHAKLINLVNFSPDGNLIVSASFDKNIKLWNNSGKYVATFRGHVGDVYQVCWSADSRLFVSGSKDSTIKVWDSKHKVQLKELPGHRDEIYSVDWSPDGKTVASGSKDRVLKLWRS